MVHVRKKKNQYKIKIKNRIQLDTYDLNWL
jgi:hypothetical protein